MESQIQILKESRNLVLGLLDKLSIEKLNYIPSGFKNNIAWNVAHLVVTQQLLCYKLSGVDCKVSVEMIEKFQKGTSPATFISEEDFNTIKKLFIALPNELEKDFNSGIFKQFSSYKTSVNITLNSIEDAINFNNYHEGIHLGIILQILKFVK